MISRSEDFRHFAEATYDRVFRAVTLAAGDSDVASDATQEAYTRALARWSRLSQEPWVEGWIITTAINFCKRTFRFRWRQHEPLPKSPIQLTEDSVSREIDLMNAIKELSMKQREAIVLHYLADVPVTGVAALMGISEGTVKAHLAHARRKLKIEMEVSDV